MYSPDVPWPHDLKAWRGQHEALGHAPYLSTWKRFRRRRMECCWAPVGNRITCDCIVMSPFLFRIFR